MGMSGWGLTARLLGKHFDSVGDKLSETIAGWDPETATEADRDRLNASLMDTAQKLAAARTSFNKEHDDVVKLRTMIENDEKVAETLAAKLAAGTISESAVTKFCDELEAEKARLPEELQQEADAKQYLDQLQQVVDAFSNSLAEFDAQAKKNLQALATAQAQKDLQALRLQRQAELDGLQGIANHSSAMAALTKKAQAVSSQADGMRIVADIKQKPLDDAKEVDDIRKSVMQGSVGESVADRLRRLSAKPADASPTASAV
jgi:chromosome segregation ATPase